MADLTVPSGAKVVIEPAPWQDAKKLKMAIQRELATSGLNLSLSSDVSSLISAFMSVDSSPAVDGALSKCLSRCTYNGEKIIESTFDPEEARADYYDIVVTCLKVNLGPLVKSLSSKLPKALLAATDKQASPATPA